MTNSSTVIIWTTVFAVAYSYSISSSLYIQNWINTLGHSYTMTLVYLLNYCFPEQCSCPLPRTFLVPGWITLSSALWKHACLESNHLTEQFISFCSGNLSCCLLSYSSVCHLQTQTTFYVVVYIPEKIIE